MKSDILSLNDLKEATEKHRGSPESRFPSVLSKLLEDERLTAVLESRFTQKEILHSAADAGVADDLGLIKTLFLFINESGEVSQTGVMVLSDANCHVVAVLKDFDPIQPNPYLPPLPYVDPTRETGIDPFRKNIENAKVIVPFLLRHETVFLSKEDYPDRYQRFIASAERFNAKHGLDSVNSTSSAKSTRECTGSSPTLPGPDDRQDCRNDFAFFMADNE